MRIGTATLALLLAAFPAAGQDKKPQDAPKPEAAPAPPPPQEDQTVTMKAKSPTLRAKPAFLKIEGTAQMIDRVQLRINLMRVAEEYGGGRLNPLYIDSGSTLVDVKGKKFSHDALVLAPGRFTATVMYVEDYQDEAIREKIKEKFLGKVWKAEFHGWSDDLIPQVSTKLLEMDSMSNDALALVQKFEKATESEVAWKAAQKDLTRETASFLSKAQKSDLGNFYPATLNQIFYTIRNVQGTSPYFIWNNGKFAGGKSYHADGEEIKTFRQEGFTYENLKRYVAEGPSIAGREFALWAVKEIRRTGSVSFALTEALKTHAEHAGTAPYTERLKVAVPADCEALEKAIREK